MNKANPKLDSVRIQTREQTWEGRMRAYNEGMTEEEALEQARRNGSLRDKPPKRRASRK
jgi:hypothetical protein